MNSQNAAFLAGGIAFGLLIGLAVANFWLPELDASPVGGAVVQGPAGPSSPTQMGAGAPAGGPPAGLPGNVANSAAPMVAEIRSLKERIQEDPGDFEALVRLANLYHDVQMFDDAIGYYEQALEARPDNPNLMTDLGTCFRNKGEHERALELFARANSLDPDHWQSLFNTVVVAGFDLGRFEEAEAALVKMENISPPPPQLGELRAAFEARRSGESPGAS